MRAEERASLANDRTGPPLVGWDVATALWRLLESKGAEIPLHQLKDRLGADDSPEGMVRELRGQGFQALPVQVQWNELAYLNSPTLLQTETGQWILLREWQDPWMVLEGRNGRLLLLPEQGLTVLSGLALDLSPSLPLEGGLWRRFYGLLEANRRRLIHVGLAGLGLQLLALLAPWLTGLVMDRALPEGAASLLNLMALGVVVVAGFRGWLGWLRQRLVLYLVTHVEIAAERSFLEHLLSLPFPFLQKKSLGECLQAFTGVVITRELLGEVFLGAVFDALMAIGYLVVMAFRWPEAAGVAVFVAVGMGALAALVGRAQARQQALEVDVRVKEQGYLTEVIKGIGTLKATGAEMTSLQRWMKLLRKANGFNLARERLGLWPAVGLEVLQQGLTIVLLVWGGKLILQGELTVGGLFAVVAMSAGFLAAVQGLVSAYLALLILRPQLAKTLEILEVKPESPCSGLPPNATSGPVVMEEVWFRYGPGQPWVLTGHQLVVEPGRLQTLTGPSGTGKSTLLRLLAGLYVPERGTISIGGLEPMAARHQLLYLPQFVQLYGGTLLENLRLFSGHASLEKLLEAAEATGLAQLIQQLPMGLQTILPQGGGSLSGGQRQLIALTAAMASQRPLLLLDEPMANLDAHLSRRLFEVLAGSHKTICLAAHAGA